MSNPNQPTIHQGVTGDGVRRLQRGLDRANPGEVLVVDGQFGPKTEMLLKQFQTSHGLVAHGIAGPLTWHALPNGGPMPTLGEGSKGPVVTALQQLLTEAAFVDGASPGPADGIYGPKTKAAVQAFQGFEHLQADGFVGEKTWDIRLNAGDPDGDTLEKAVGLTFASV